MSQKNDIIVIFLVKMYLMYVELLITDFQSYFVDSIGFCQLYMVFVHAKLVLKFQCLFLKIVLFVCFSAEHSDSESGFTPLVLLGKLTKHGRQFQKCKLFGFRCSATAYRCNCQVNLNQ